ncbi:type II toxin-antitoxin system ParD family antitoxin [Aquibium sp. ELW1220]|uniref:ribbon-helix-helix domain-containing protein n=1 Tax=Aquibium sp. ELW1220 TaxID=2976766 RepID=UPI0025B2623B|nr:type II toxin-antitoxin system ParD family antitoxin [Aquibium sp. ELW1220]MDN2579525.1 type II toxin-antitoxin system ParD family antitoxin [Aquibium sp. ELW1220]
MSSVIKRTVELIGNEAAFVDKKVAAGEYASAIEVVRAGLSALQDRDLAVERWLREDVVATYDKVEAGEPLAEAHEAFEEIRERHLSRIERGK